MRTFMLRSGFNPAIHANEMAPGAANEGVLTI